MKLTEKTKTYLKYSTANQEVADEVIFNLETSSSIIPVLSDPVLPSDGDFWYNQTTGDVKFRQNGVTITERNILGKQVLLAGTTSYIPSPGTKYIDMIVIGGGGGGGAVVGSGANQAGGGGGGGGAVLYAFIPLTDAPSYSCIIGTGGAGGSGGAAPGDNGGLTSITIGPLTYTANGGLGGAAQVGGITYTFAIGGVGGASPSLGDIKVGGQAGHAAIRLDGAAGGILSGRGADSAFGAGGASFSTTATGNSATGFGAGGGGACIALSAGSRNGGAGSNGAIIITEYA